MCSTTFASGVGGANGFASALSRRSGDAMAFIRNLPEGPAQTPRLVNSVLVESFDPALNRPFSRLGARSVDVDDSTEVQAQDMALRDDGTRPSRGQTC